MRLWAAVVVCLASVAAAVAQELPPQEQYRLQGAYWRWTPDLTATIQKGSGGEAGTLLDPRTDLGFTNRRTYEIRGAIQLKPGHKVRGGYTPIDYRGDLAAPRTFRFGASTYVQGERVVTTFKGNYYTAAYEFDLVKS